MLLLPSSRKDMRSLGTSTTRGDRRRNVGTPTATAAAGRVDGRSIGEKGKHVVTSIKITAKEGITENEDASSSQEETLGERKIKKLRAELEKAEQSKKDELAKERTHKGAGGEAGDAIDEKDRLGSSTESRGEDREGTAEAIL